MIPEIEYASLVQLDIFNLTLHNMELGHVRNALQENILLNLGVLSVLFVRLVFISQTQLRQHVKNVWQVRTHH
jgi:hypothetical protein